MREYLRGYSDDMQLEIADDLLDCATGQSIHYTGLTYVDRMLKAFYLLISEEMGRDLGELIALHQEGGGGKPSESKSLSEAAPHLKPSPYRPTITINQTKTISFN